MTQKKNIFYYTTVLDNTEDASAISKLNAQPADGLFYYKDIGDVGCGF